MTSVLRTRTCCLCDGKGYCPGCDGPCCMCGGAGMTRVTEPEEG